MNFQGTKKCHIYISNTKRSNLFYYKPNQRVLCEGFFAQKYIVKVENANKLVYRKNCVKTKMKSSDPISLYSLCKSNPFFPSFYYIVVFSTLNVGIGVFELSPDRRFTHPHFKYYSCAGDAQGKFTKCERTTHYTNHSHTYPLSHFTVIFQFFNSLFSTFR